MKRPAVLDPLHQKLATYAAREHDDTFFNLYATRRRKIELAIERADRALAVLKAQ